MGRWWMILVVVVFALLCCVNGLGVNWGTQATHKLPPSTVVQMLKDNGITKVKLFDADSTTMAALAGSNLEVMVAIPNDQLASMTDYNRAKQWVNRNVSRYAFNGGVNIKYVPKISSFFSAFLLVVSDGFFIFWIEFVLFS